MTATPETTIRKSVLPGGLRVVTEFRRRVDEAVIGDATDTAIILGIVVLNSAVGFVQELRAERAMAALKRLALDKPEALRPYQHGCSQMELAGCGPAGPGGARSSPQLRPAAAWRRRAQSSSA